MAYPLRYDPHPGQRAIHCARDKRFRVICTGRRFGKTLCLAGELLDRGGEEPGDYGWVAPTYNVAERGREAFMEAAERGRPRFVGRAPARVEFKCKFGGISRVWFLSADNPENIRGYGFREYDGFGKNP